MGSELTLNLSQRLEAFERAWAGATVPDVAAFLTDAAHQDRLGILHELILIDLEMRWKPIPSDSEPDATVSEAKGIPAKRWKIEDYLQRYRDLGSVSDVSIELL